MQKKTVFKSLLGVIAATLMSACGNNDLVDSDNQVGADQTVEGAISIQNVASCSMNPVADGFGIVCDGSLIGTLKHGSNGKDGSDGKDGSGCSLAELDEGLGFQVTCGENVGVITNGKNGRDGEGCSMSNVPTGIGMYLVCGEQVALIKNGEDGSDGKDGLDGKDGVNCAATAVSNGYALYCGDELVGVVRHGKDGKDGVDGANGSSCYADPYEDGNASGFNLYCADSLIGIILNGKDGQDGTSSTDTLFISSLDTVVVKDSSYIFSKDTLIVRDSILLRDSTYIVVYDTIVKKDTLVFKDTLVVKDTLVISKKDTTVLSKKDTIVVSKRDTVVVSKQDTVVISKKDTVVVRDTIVKKDTTVINNAVGCNIAKVVGSTVYIACGTDTTTVEANITINNTYNNGKLETTTFDPIIVYVSSSSEDESSSSAQVIIINPSSSSNSVAPGTVKGRCKLADEFEGWDRPFKWKIDYSPEYHNYAAVYIPKGTKLRWIFVSDASNDVLDVMNSIYEWKFEGTDIASYTVAGLDVFESPEVTYTKIGEYKTSLSINGEQILCTYQDYSYPTLVRVETSKVNGCRCSQDPENSDENGIAWILHSCQSDEPIESYTWTGVSEYFEDGTSAYTPFNTAGTTSVRVTNRDGESMVATCGNTTGKYLEYRSLTNGNFFSTEYKLGEGTHLLTYNCKNENFGSSVLLQPSLDGEGRWISPVGNHGDILENTLVDGDKLGSTNAQFVVEVKSGEITVSCSECNSGTYCTK